MAIVRLCEVCGKLAGACNTPHTPGSGLTINRIDKKELGLPMNSIRISKERWYLSKDRTRAVPEGDPDAEVLLVGKGGEIDPVIADRYGIETTGATAVAVVPRDLNAEREAMISPGTSAETIANYDKMIATREANQEVAQAVATRGNPATSRQAGLMVEGLVNERVAAGDTTTPGVAKTADTSGGKSGGGVTEGETTEGQTLNRRTRVIGKDQTAPQTATDTIGTSTPPVDTPPPPPGEVDPPKA